MTTAYLNQAGTSWPKPEPVRAAVNAALTADPSAWPEQFEAAHRQVASFFHIDDPSRLLLTPGCTSALSLAIADHAWAPGDRILTSSWEHRALQRPLVKLSERGVNVEIQPGTAAEPLDLAALESALQSGPVKLVALTAASNVTGALLPIADVIELAHRHDALVLIDAAQVAGWWDIDVPELNADLWIFAGHKGPQAPWGIGGLYVAPHVTMNSPNAQCDVPPPGETVACSAMPGYCDGGSVDRAALAGLQAAVAWLQLPEQLDRLPRARALAAEFHEAAASLPGVTLYGPPNPDARMPTVAFNIDGLTSSEVARQFAAADVAVGSGLQCAPLAHQTLGTAPSGVVRCSFGPSNTDNDLETAIAALRQIAS